MGGTFHVPVSLDDTSNKKNALSGRCFHRRFPVGTAFFHSSEKADCQNGFPAVGPLWLICRYGKTKRSGLSQACFDGFVEIPAKALSAITGKSSLTAVFLAVFDLCPLNAGTILYGRGKKTVTVCGGNRPSDSHFHGMGRFGRIPFPDVDTGFIA